MSIGSCIVLYRMVDWSNFAHSLKSANIYWIFFAYVNMNLDRFFMSYKWYLLIRGLGVPIKFSSTLKAYYVGAFWSTFLPASIGADLVRVGWCINEGQSGSKIVSSVFIERLLGILALGIVALASLILAIYHYKLKLHSVFGIVLLALVGSIVIILATFNQRMHRFIRKIVSYLPVRLGTAIDKVMGSILLFKEKPNLLILFLMLSICEQAFPIMSLLLLAKAFSINLPFIWALIGVPLILVVVRVPISISGIGIKEGFYAFVFSLANIPVNQSLLMALTDRVLLLFTAVPGVFWTINGTSPRPDFSIQSQDSGLTK